VPRRNAQRERERLLRERERMIRERERQRMLQRQALDRSRRPGILLL
jgi:hypothetical protein